MRLRHYLLQDHRQTQWRRTPSRLYLEKIVVTPRRREETLQDLPLSIAVVSAQDLVTQGIYSTNQVGAQARLGNGGTLTPMPGMYWQSDYDWQPPALPGADPQMGFCQQDSYAKLRARLTYESAGSNYAVPLFGRNITDDLILSNCNYGFGLAYSTYEAPAMWGLEFNGRWGNN